jgi:glycosyltransferase involved in cell wall biosynthesis
MSSPTLSVVLPTYNRKEILSRVLEALESQTRRDLILEILVVDDGSSDGTNELVSRQAAEAAVAIRMLRQQNQGLAAARNHGIREAKGEIILFIDDDEIPAPNLVEEHMAWHQQHPDLNFGMVGYIPWSPEVRPTPLMWYIISEGPQYGFGHMTAGGRVGFVGCYFANTSVKTQFLRENGMFDESFRTWGCEDWDLGYRLIKKGLVMIYNPRAIVFHYRRVRFAEVCQFRKKMAQSLKLLATKEAGQAYFAKERERKASRRYRLEMLAVRIFVPLVMPLKPLLDSRIRLPWAIYRAFLAYYFNVANEIPSLSEQHHS